MHHPAHVDGRSLVLLKRTGHRFAVVDSGLLSHDGENLELPSGHRITDDELGKFQSVISSNRIPECAGFDFYVVVDDAR
ncbi:MAG: hypothetical protein WD151_04505 [Phycisphaeraceae bacterium]